MSLYNFNRAELLLPIWNLSTDPLWPHLPTYLQVRHPLLKGLRVVPQGLLLLQELGIPSFSSRLEEAIVVNVPQWLVERTDDLLFSVPHGAVQVKLETPLTDRGHRATWRSEVRSLWKLSRIRRRMRASNLMTNVSKSNPCCYSWCLLRCCLVCSFHTLPL